MRKFRFIFPSLLLLLTFCCWSPLGFAADWQPISPEELALKDNPAKPGSKAMILYRQIERDDAMGSQSEYVRIKVFTQEGKEYGDVVIGFDRAAYNVESVHGRTIHPDGSIIPFNGKVYEKVIAQGQGLKYRAKAFTMPDVIPGSILEYRYVLRWEASDPATRSYYYFPRSEWEVGSELYQKAAHFKFKPLSREGLFWTIRTWGLPANANIAQDKLTQAVSLDVADIPGVEKEEYMPPKRELIARVLIFYDDARIPPPEEYWKDRSKKLTGWSEDFMNKKNAVTRDLASVVSASDSPDTKLRKIYEHVQSFENLEYESEKTEKELKALKLKDNKNVEDVINSKAGYRNELNRTFAAMARAAGFEVRMVRVTERDSAIFHKEWPSSAQLGTEIAVVRQNGKDMFLDPGSPFCPFGVVPWEDTAVTGLQLEKNGPNWVQIPIPENDDSGIKRVAKMKLEDDGSLTGEVEVIFSGQEAFHRRLWERNEDEAGRKKDMEELLQAWIPMKAEIELVKVNDWKSSVTPLNASYKVTVPGYASQAGRRVLLPSTLFADAYKNPFTGTKRVHPIVMEFTYDHADDVTVTLPQNFKVESLPKAITDKNGVGELSVNCTNDNGTLRLTRDFKLRGLFLDTKYYEALRNYFQFVQAGTNEQAVLRTGS